METINLREKEISSSALKAAKVSIRNLHWYYQKPKEKKSNLDFGNAIELYLIDRKEFDATVVVFDDAERPVPDKNYQTKANKEWKDNFFAKNEGKYIINKTGKESMEVIKAIDEMLQAHPHYDKIINNDNDYQREFRWICPVTGLKRYCRTDLSNSKERYIIDIKTYADDDFLRACVNNDYFIQALDQIAGFEFNHEYPLDQEVPALKYYWLAISKSEPYHLDFYEFDSTSAMKAEEVYARVLNDINQHIDTPVNELMFKRVAMDKIRVPNYYK